MTQYPERAECDFGMISNFPGEEQRLPQKGVVEVEGRISQEIQKLLLSLPEQYRKDVGLRVRRILFIKG